MDNKILQAIKESEESGFDNITFRQFIESYNFRKLNYDGGYDAKTIRIHFGSGDNWFDFGVYDFDSSKWERASCVLSKEILESIVSDFSYNEDDEKMHVVLRYWDKDEK